MLGLGDKFRMLMASHVITHNFLGGFFIDFRSCDRCSVTRSVFAQFSKDLTQYFFIDRHPLNGDFDRL